MFVWDEPILELRVDGVIAPFHHGWRTQDNRFESDSRCYVYSHYLDEGQEIPLSATLMEFSDFQPDAERLRYAAAHRRRRSLNLRRRPQFRRRDRYPRIFLNYRREDADAFAGRLHETLVREFGADDVFMDQFSIRPGEAFAWTIQQAVAHADVMVSLIGARWSTIADAQGRRRLDSMDDFVRREVTAALDRGSVVIPVVLPGGGLPAAAGLSGEMIGLGELQVLELSPRSGRHARRRSRLRFGTPSRIRGSAISHAT